MYCDSLIRSACSLSDRRVALSWMMLDTMTCPCLGWTPPLSDRSSSVHKTQRICFPRVVWLVHLLDSVLMLSSVGENVQRRILRRALARGTIFFLLNFFGSRKKRRHVTWATREGGKSQTQLRWLSQARAAAGGFTQAPGPRESPRKAQTGTRRPPRARSAARRPVPGRAPRTYCRGRRLPGPVHKHLGL